ncbi:IniB N-terminal domain-containing protein [Lentzea sp. BCCO 10_0798]|jgi:hypothetical protein|uniref:IniB N-terminal domain-containing protein n=1 Tax=Lentzea kristufekii TaxID=3095430 RepID=A0ABU4U755_9PSEU|nr:IniB N-terminal domain-containing protein [Lentzea sp. BCCO 10_0798]MDX8056419.1 IniB N-terminal domain-containing protein [Lentzea sp. BCCO 10_0798]
MIQPSTLHDFVLNLLSDPSLKDAFAADAQGTLEQAGLADITAVDVQEVIPLVLDLLPATPAGLPAIDGVDLTLPAGDVLADGPLGAISQLQAVASQLTSSGVNLTDLQTSSAGMLAVGEDGLQLAAANQSLGEYARAGLGIDGDFSAVTDVTSVLDQTASPVTGTVLDVADTATATVDAPLDGVTSTAGLDGVLGQLGGVTGLGHDALGVLGGGDLSLGVLNTSGLDDLANGDVGAHSVDTIGQVTSTATGLVGTATGVASTATGVAGDHGVGNVLGTVTDVTHNVPVVGDLDLGLLG